MKEGGEGREKERVLGKREREALPIKSKSKMAIYLPVGRGYTGCSVVHFISAP